ncbi:unnamed protein product [Rangifer tarandus platyrhynchus]|uniref:Uncharacterized protein n=2 Tax=Rangifer tarandus platyrhynchus TaxID=3082113 RepID=A0ACB0F2Q1_RANTA|nr:unnamed protein product [Rangifer tarandus platyrhynchus]CAI9706947.1 unnamed protein product [Rangifer tarandus platyrhynchus]
MGLREAKHPRPGEVGSAGPAWRWGEERTPRAVGGGLPGGGERAPFSAPVVLAQPTPSFHPRLTPGTPESVPHQSLPPSLARSRAAAGTGRAGRRGYRGTRCRRRTTPGCVGGESPSTASERRGGAGGRGHARRQSREAASVSNTVAMATWPGGTGSSRNSCRRGPRARPPPPCEPVATETGSREAVRAAAASGAPARACARGQPRATDAGWGGRRGGGQTLQLRPHPDPQTCLAARLDGKEKKKRRKS